MSDRVRFIHAADLHLDAPFQGIAAADAAVGHALAEATFEAFGRVVDAALDRHVDFVVIAGDAYNSAEKSLRAQLRFREQLQRLDEARIRTFVVHGNHDPRSGWSAGLTLPDSVTVFSASEVERAEVVRHGRVICAVYGRSFGRAAEAANLAREYRRQEGDPVAVAVLHANVGGQPGYDPYAPASLDDLRAARMDYWALGHIHKREVLAENPWVVYSGSPQGLTPNEAGAHGCYLVEVAPGGSVALEFIETASVAWERAEIDVSGCDTLDDVRAELGGALRGVLRASGRSVIARATLTGRAPVHADLARPGVAADVLEDVRHELLGGGSWLWLDRLDDRTASPLDIDSVRSGSDFASELVRVADEIAADPAALQALLDELTVPVATALGGYDPGVAAGDALLQARDVALDLLLAEEGDAR